MTKKNEKEVIKQKIVLVYGVSAEAKRQQCSSLLLHCLICLCLLWRCPDYPCLVRQERLYVIFLTIKKKKKVIIKHIIL